jgi:hypothetical protein
MPRSEIIARIAAWLQKTLGPNALCAESIVIGDG